MTEQAQTSDNFCYRHPKRQSFVLCQRCGRTVCPDCQTPSFVGVHCPECVREARQSAPRTKSAIVTSLRRGSGPVVTYSIIALSVLVYLLQWITGGDAGPVTRTIAYAPLFTLSQPWTMLTAIFAHGSIIHLLFNMYSLFVFGPALEQALGRARFLALYLIAGFGGSVAVLLLDPLSWVLGASGAIFGLMGAFFIIQRRMGGSSPQLLIVIVLNLVIGFVLPNVSWQAHVGGLIVGGLVAWINLRTRQRQQQRLQVLLLAGLVLVLCGIALIRFFELF